MKSLFRAETEIVVTKKNRPFTRILDGSSASIVSRSNAFLNSKESRSFDNNRAVRLASCIAFTFSAIKFESGLDLANSFSENLNSDSFRIINNEGVSKKK
jgi:hypothetical protein